MQREDASIQRLEKILSKHGRKHSSEDARPHHSRPEESVAEQPVESDASLRDFAIGTGREAAQAQRQTGVMLEGLESSVLENALKEQVYQLNGQWQQGAQRLSTHLEEALHDLAEVRQQENDLLKRRVALCHQELDGQVAQLERSFHLKVEQCKQQVMARIADQRAECEMAIKAKAESLLGELEHVDAVPSLSASGLHGHAADQRTASPHSLAHAACVCYEQDGDFQYSGADAQTAGPVKRRLNYLSPDTSTDRHIPLSVQKYMHGASDRQGWWKPARLAVPEGRKHIIRKPVSQQRVTDDVNDSPAYERLASFGVSFRKYRPCSCRTRAGMLAPRPPLRLSHLLEQSDDDL